MPFRSAAAASLPMRSANATLPALPAERYQVTSVCMRGHWYGSGGALCVALTINSTAGQATPQKLEGVEVSGDVTGLQPADLRTLHQILRTSRVTTAVISSTERTPEHQARVMYDLAKEDLAGAKDLYCDEGDIVLERYNNKKPRAEVLADMLAELLRQLPKARERGCLNHVENDAVYAVDIASSSVPEEAFAALVRAGKKAVKDGKVVRFLYPPSDKRAFHFEFKKTSKASKR